MKQKEIKKFQKKFVKDCCAIAKWNRNNLNNRKEMSCVETKRKTEN